MTPTVILADANVLLSRTLRDYFLYLAYHGAIEIHWSQEILDEMSRNLRKNRGFRQEDTEVLERLMNNFLLEALVEVDPDDLERVQSVEMDAKDRHVLAAALSSDANIVLTANDKHFPREWMAQRGIELLRPRQCLERIADQQTVRLRQAHATTLKYSKKSETQVLETLERDVGKRAADAVRIALGLPIAPVTRKPRADTAQDPSAHGACGVSPRAQPG